MGLIINGIELSSEEKYRIISNFTYDWEEWRGPNYELIYISPSCERVTGYPVQAFYDNPNFRDLLVHPDDRPQIAEHHLMNINLPTGIHQMDFRIIAPDGSVRWINHYCQPVYLKDGTVLGRRASNRDITTRILAEEEIFKEKQKFEAILTNIADSVVGMKPDGKIIYANLAAVQAMGFSSPDSFVEFSQLFDRFEFSDENGQPLTISKMPVEEAFATLIEAHLTVQYRRLDTGERGWYLIKTGPVYGPDNNLLMVIIIVQDITELKRTQEDLKLIQVDLEQRVEERTFAIRRINRDLRLEIAARKKIEQDLQQERDFSQSLIQTAQVGLLVLDPQGKVLQMNPFLEQVSKYKLEEVIHKDWFEIFIPDANREEVKRAFELAIHDVATKGIISSLRTKDGQTRLVEWYDKTLKDLQGQVIGLLSIGQDVTERIRIEEKVRRNAAQAEALANITARINAKLDLDSVLHNICEETVRAIPSLPSSNVMLLDEESDQFFIAAAYGKYLSLIDEIVPIPRADYEQYHEKYGPIIVIPDVRGVPNFQDARINDILQIRTVVSVRMVHHGKLIGSLALVSHDVAYIPSAEELAFIQALANHATIAIANARLFQQVSESQKRLQSLSQRLVEIQENERWRLARELHDEIGQVLTSLILVLEMIKNSCQHRDTNPDEISGKLENAQEMVNYLLKQVRELALDLRPGLLDDLGLLPTLLMHFERYQQQTQIQVNFKHSGIDRRFSGEIETTVFRIIQEALTNVARHAKVNQVDVRLWLEINALHIQVQDDGIGFDANQILTSNESIGILGMQERVGICGGRMEIESQPGLGTCLTTELPVSSRPGD